MEYKLASPTTLVYSSQPQQPSRRPAHEILKGNDQIGEVEATLMQVRMGEAKAIFQPIHLEANFAIPFKVMMSMAN
jgi:hypothetical protein